MVCQSVNLCSMILVLSYSLLCNKYVNTCTPGCPFVSLPNPAVLNVMLRRKICTGDAVTIRLCSKQINSFLLFFF